MSTWKKYGGLSHVESQNSISAYSLSVDIFTLRQAYFGTFDICGELHVSGNALVDTDVRSNNVTVKNDISCNQLFVTMGSNHFGDMNVTGNVTVLSGDVRIVTGNVDLSHNLYLSKKLFLGNAGLYLYGTDISGNIGINTTSPQSALDFQSTRPFMLNLATSNSTNYSVLSKTAAGDGVIVYADASNARLDFFVDGSTNVAAAPDARLACTPGGNFSIDVSSNTAILSNVSISNRSSQAISHVYGETAVIYDNSASIYQYAAYQKSQSIAGNALTLVANDASSVTFMNAVSSDKKGLAIGGGAYPNDMTRAMGTIGLLDCCGNYMPAINLVDASSNVFRKFAVGINTYAPEVDNYVLSMNGPTHMKNGQLTITTQANIEIYKLSLAKTNTKYGIAIGSPYTTDASNDDLTYKYRQKAYYTTNGGEKWTDISLDASNGIHNTTVESKTGSDQAPVPRYIHDVFMVDASLAFMCANGIINYSNSSGAKWYGVSNLDIRNYYSAYVYGIESLAFFADSSGNVTYFNYPSPSIYTDIDGIPVTAIVLAVGYSGIPCLSGAGTVLSGAGAALFLAAGASIYQLDNIGGPGLVTSTPLFTNGTVTYNSIYAFDTLNVIAVGSGVITWTNNGFAAYTNISVPGVVLNSVHIIDASNAIAVGNGGVLMYTVDGYATWKSVSSGVMNSSGNGNTLLDSSYNLTNVRCLDINQFYVTKTIRAYASASTFGNTSLFHCYIPELFNNANNVVLDMSGSTRISGDVNINDGGRLRTNNGTFYLVDTCANIIRMGGEAANVFIGNKASSTTTVNSSLVTLKDASFNGNVVIGGKSKMYGNTTFSNCYVFSSYYDSSDTTGSINIGGLNYASLPGMGSNPGSRKINVGNFNLTVDMSCVINIGGAQDKIVFGGSVYNNASLNIGSYLFINYMADVNSSPHCGLKFGESGASDAGYFVISNDMGGFLLKSTVAKNVVRLDVSNLVYNGAGNQGIITLSKLGSGVDASYSIQSGNIDLSNVFVKNWTLSSTDLQTVDTSMSVLGRVAIGKSSFIANTNVDISGNALVSARLGVGNTSVNGAYAFDVLGNSNLGGNMNVTGLATAMGNLAVNKGSVTAGYALDVAGNTNISGYQRFVSSSSASGVNFGNSTTCVSRIYNDGNLILWSQNNMYFQTGGTATDTTAPTGVTNETSILYLQKNGVGINTESVTSNYILDIAGNTKISGNANVFGNITAGNGLTVSAGNVLVNTGYVGINKVSVTAGYALDVAGNTNISGNVTAGNGLTVSAGNALVTNGYVGINKSSITTGYALDVSGNAIVSGNLNVVSGVVSIQKVFGYLISSMSSVYTTNNGDILGLVYSNVSYYSGITDMFSPNIVTYTPITANQYYTFVFNYNYTSNPTGFTMYVYPNYSGGGTRYYIGVVAPNSLSGSISATYLLTGGMTTGRFVVEFSSPASMTTTGVSFYVLTGSMASPPAMPLFVAGNTTVTGAINLNGITVNSGTVSFPPLSISSLAINGLSTSIPGINTAGNVAINKSSVTAGYVIDVSGNTNVSGNITVGNGLSVSAGNVLVTNGYVGINKLSVTEGYALDVNGNLAVSSRIISPTQQFTGFVYLNNTALYTLSVAQSGSFVFVQTAATITLPIPSASSGAFFYITCAAPCTITTPSGQFTPYPSATSINILAGGSVHVRTEGSNWGILGGVYDCARIASNNLYAGASNAFNGNVGIGVGKTSITSPYALDVSGDTFISGNILTGASQSIVLKSATTTGINFGTIGMASAQTSKIYDNGHLHVWTDDHFYVDVSGSCTNPASEPLGATTMIYANKSGVGINKNSVISGYALDVNGSTTISGYLGCGDNIGSQGQLLYGYRYIYESTFSITTAMSGWYFYVGSNCSISIPAKFSGAIYYIASNAICTITSASGDFTPTYTSSITLLAGGCVQLRCEGQAWAIVGGNYNCALLSRNNIFAGNLIAGGATTAIQNGGEDVSYNTSTLGLGFGGGGNGTLYSFKLESIPKNRGGSYYDYGTQSDLVISRKLTNTYNSPVNGVSDNTYSECLRVTGPIGTGVGGGDGGYVGINTSAPECHLDVSGNVKVRGNLTVANGFTVSTGTVSFPNGSINSSAISGGVNVTGINSVGNVAINKTFATILANTQLDVNGNLAVAGGIHQIYNGPGINFGETYPYSGIFCKIYGDDNFNFWSDNTFKFNIGGDPLTNMASFPTGATTMIYANPSGVGINKDAVTFGYALDVSGNVYASGNAIVSGNVSANFFNSTSDGRLKTDVKPLLNTFDTIKNIDAVSFAWKGNAKSDYGFIAQNVFEHLPDMRPNNWTASGDPVDASGNPVYYAMDYSKMTPHLWGAVDDLIRENAQLKQRIAVIEAALGI